MLLIAQFIAYFNYSNMSAAGRDEAGRLPRHTPTSAPCRCSIGFILLVFVIDIIMPGVIPKWAIIAPIFIPLFYNLGIAPQTVIAAYRVGDGPVNVITPLMVYLPFIILVCQRYRKSRRDGHGGVDDDAVHRRRARDVDALLRRSGTSSASRGAPARPSISDPGVVPWMMLPSALVILGAVVVLFIWNRLPVGVVAILTTLALWATGLLTAEAVLAGFGDPVVVFIATLFVVSEGIDSDRASPPGLGQLIVAPAGAEPGRSCWPSACCAPCSPPSITLNGAVAALLPLVVLLAMRIGQPPSQMLMPLAFAGSAGGLLMLTGSPVNVIVSEAAQDGGAPPFPFFSFAVVGVPLLVGTVAICVLLGPRLLPHRATGPPGRRPRASRRDPRAVLLAHRRLLPAPGAVRSPLVGATAAGSTSGTPRRALVGVQAPARRPVPTHARRRRRARRERPPHEVSRIDARPALAVAMDGSADAGALLTREAGVAEVVVPPRSSLVGEKVYPGMKRAVRPRHPRGPAAGQGPPAASRPSWPPATRSCSRAAGRPSTRCRTTATVLLVDSPDVVRRQAVPWGPKATVAVAIVAGMVVLLAFGIVPPAIAGLIAATAMVVTRVVSVPQAYRSVSWQTVVLIGGLIPLTTAIRTSGAADQIASVITAVVGDGRPFVLMVAMFLLTAVLGQIVSNTATVLIVTPIAVSAAAATAHLGPAGAHAHRGRGVSSAADPDRDPGQPHGDDAGRLPVRGLLAARAADDAVVAGREPRRDPAGLAVLTQARTLAFIAANSSSLMAPDLCRSASLVSSSTGLVDGAAPLAVSVMYLSIACLESRACCMIAFLHGAATGDDVDEDTEERDEDDEDRPPRLAPAAEVGLRKMSRMMRNSRNSQAIQRKKYSMVRNRLSSG